MLFEIFVIFETLTNDECDAKRRGGGEAIQE